MNEQQKLQNKLQNERYIQNMDWLQVLAQHKI